jgi:hypothetical protein
MRRAPTLPDEYLIYQLQSVARAMGEVPTTRRWRREGRRPNHATYLRHFGSWENALRAAGLIEDEKPT